MIHIQTIQDDNSSNDVMDWVYYLSNYKVKRINGVQQINDLLFNINNNGEQINLKTDDNNIISNEIGSYWYRRGIFSFNRMMDNSLNRQLGWESYKYLEVELKCVLENIHSSLKDNFTGINKAQDNETNKITNLKTARRIGLLIPDTLICTNKQVLLTFLRKHKRIISKVINSSQFHVKSIDNDKIRVGNIVQIIEENDICKLNDTIKTESFLPSLFQEYIEKKFELRIFFLNGAFYTMAIFSQQNEQTKVDYRNYDYARPNRCVPYKLPSTIEKKLLELMNLLDLNSGSIDMIYSALGQYVFLEVNPIGQYQWLDRACNFYIDKKIAEHLIDNYAY